MKYIYKALKPGGKEVSGEIEAVDEQEAKRKIREFGIYPINLLPSQLLPSQHLTRCRHCQKEVATTAESCPHCGGGQPGLSSNTVTITSIITIVGLAIFIIFAVRYCVNISKETDNISREAERLSKELSEAGERVKKSLEETKKILNDL